uniref:TIP120 domain-containing protein n=1 Tax=Globodera pallida TaxID=36090 RepID=A0A183CNB4_GLOPA
MRKRAITTLGHLADVVSDEQFDRIVMKVLSTCDDPETELCCLKTFIIAVIAICRTSGARFAKFLSQIVPVLIQKCESEEDDELREICLQAFEIFAFRCTSELSPFVASIVQISIEMLSYDPNYNYGAEEDCIDAMEMEDEEAGEQDDTYSDDDDLSWKVRKSAAKCIEALITFRAEKLVENHFGQLLISRFREREDNVKYDIFTAYSALLRLTKQMNPELASFQSQNTQSGNELLVETFPPSRFQQILKDEFTEEQKAVFAKLQQQDKDISIQAPQK